MKHTLKAHRSLCSRKNIFYTYEHRKREWLTRNPTATHQEYEDAIRKIIEELRI